MEVMVHDWSLLKENEARRIFLCQLCGSLQVAGTVACGEYLEASPPLNRRMVNLTSLFLRPLQRRAYRDLSW